jgi:hypothetical protein
MASIGLSEAARLTGRNASTIHRSMKTGRLSYTRDEAGNRQIDVSEQGRSGLGLEAQRESGRSAASVKFPL